MPKKQTELQGMEAPSIGEIDNAGEEYVTHRDARIARLAKEIEAKKKLLDLMEKHKLTVYRFDDMTVEVTPGTKKIKVKRIGESEDEE